MSDFEKLSAVMKDVWLLSFIFLLFGIFIIGRMAENILVGLLISIFLLWAGAFIFYEKNIPVDVYKGMIAAVACWVLLLVFIKLVKNPPPI